ncbi:lactosylceramide 4-alpha-galactosyltransferase [Stomoxys calcitrans]|uniref:Alpha 1,4-glycosyltransferase domain-containing protein n=1 Tax=Stomoxys calcitrans TaxID=35570 RepID=A0A1I8PPY6_STOCA|nr:lactosylceramide 4-alpha-galactosyltransferase [Stomoxys calcitrans]
MSFFRLQKLLGKFTLVNFHLRLMFLMLLLLCMIGVIFNFYRRTDLSPCFMDSPALDNRTKLDDVLFARILPDAGKSIFFHETSCPHISSLLKADVLSEESRHINVVKLNARQACAIESAAVHNPSSKVFVLFASPRYRSLNNSNDPIVDAILSYDNVHLRNLNLWTYSAGTPAYDLLKDGSLFKSSYVLSHISDFLRYLTLWRWGGTYLDMDIVMLRSMEDVPPNYTGAESDSHLAAGVMNFAHDGFGHEIAEECLLDLQRNFDGSNWGNNGPGVITRVIKRVCQTTNIRVMQDTKRCMGFKVFPIEAFYAIPWMEWSHFFEAEMLDKTMARMKNSFVAHVWNKHSIKRQIQTDAKPCAYSVLAKKHCPRVYKAAGEYF